MAAAPEVVIPVRLKDVTVPINLAVTVNLEVENAGASNFDDVGDFHRKFGLPAVPLLHDDLTPLLLSHDMFEFRIKFLQEELNELIEADATDDLAGVADALVDLVYVAMGTAHLMDLPWQDLWDEVQRANMSKVRASTADESARSSGRGHSMDVIKGPDFVPPDIAGVLARAARRGQGQRPERE